MTPTPTERASRGPRFLRVALVAATLAASTALLSLTPQHAQAQGDRDPGEQDQDALIALYRATNGDNWTNNAKWLSGAPLGEWYGVRTNPDGRVTELYLGHNELRGDIPPDLNSLTSLVAMDLSANRLTGEIPADLADLEDLQEFYLGSNDLLGEIPPQLGQLGSLRVLDLSGNILEGDIPRELGDLSRLHWRETGAVRSSPSPPPLASQAAATPSEVGNQRRWGRLPSSARRCGRQSASPRRRSRSRRSRRLEAGSRVKRASSETVTSGVAQRSSSVSLRRFGR